MKMLKAFLIMVLPLLAILPNAYGIQYKKLGCFKDEAERAILSLEGTNPVLDGPYRSRTNTVEKCYKAALSNGYKVFAVQDDGQCMSSATAEKTYNKYGTSTACAASGKGGPMANNVYQILEVCKYNKMGGAVLAQGGQIVITSVASAEECGAKCNAKDGCGSIMFFDYLTGSKGSNCFLYTKELDGSEPINGKIDKRFFSYFKTCVLAGLDESKKAEVESLALTKDAPYISRGCWQDEYAQRALTDIDQDVVSLKKGHYKRREHPEQNCMEAAKARGFKVFALQDGGQCFGSDDLNGYKRYGGSTKCSDGTGGPFANSVYEIREEPVTEAAPEPEVVTEEATSAEVKTEVATEAVPANTAASTTGCCTKVKVESKGIGRRHSWAMGTYVRSEKLEKIALGTKTIYMQNKAPGNTEQYYLEGSENEGWKIGRLWSGEVEKLIMYNGVKIKCPADQRKSDWLVSDANGYSPDSQLEVQCIE